VHNAGKAESEVKEQYLGIHGNYRYASKQLKNGESSEVSKAVR
jgi:hypothetical protein